MFHGGDEDEKESPRDFLNKLERMYMLKTQFQDQEKVNYFQLSLKDGGPASQWFDALPATEKATWNALKAAYNIRWPAKTAMVKTQAEKQAELSETKIGENDLGRKVKVNGIEVYTHVAWADKVERLAKAIPDDNNLLVQITRNSMAPSLRALVAHSHNTWATFCRAVREVDVNELREKKDEKARAAKMEKDVEILRALRQQPPPTPSKVLGAAFAKMDLGPRIPQPSFGPPRPTNPQYTNQTPAAARARTDAQKWEIIQRLPAPLPDTPGNRATYQVSITRWYSMFPGATAATEDRPFPLKPGTCALGTGECSDCGMMGHRSDTCTAQQKLPNIEIKWRRKVNSIKGAVTRAANQTTAVNLVDDGGFVMEESEYRARLEEELRPQLEAQLRAQLYAEILAEQERQGNGEGSSD
ncbi:hypothetical protein LshimejAT787_2100020 [Lyophyllum shimeji]|uniref:CCHC-type domain-containing protein n=1 Tax=Lyophyllum shimeji TaxID=47721 RepID=A0A9P3Q1T3_LYOSH|nr:hypothetical protein LshimejAT787_2100020 [Lyophyllum shimeji]